MKSKERHPDHSRTMKNYLRTIPERVFSWRWKMYFGIIVWDTDGRVLYANPAVKKYMKKRQDGWVQRIWWTIQRHGPISCRLVKYSGILAVIPPEPERWTQCSFKNNNRRSCRPWKNTMGLCYRANGENLPYLDAVDGSTVNGKWFDKTHDTQSIVGRSSVFKTRIELKKIAVSNMPLLLFGESGVGKNLYRRVALSIIAAPEKNRAFSVNCGAIPENLLAELWLRLRCIYRRQ